MRVVHLHGKFLLSEIEIFQLPPVEELQEEGEEQGEEEERKTQLTPHRIMKTTQEY